ncbi:MAG TPA: serine/threonine-protein kinase [Vicinamibacterales bacterium]|nr:serine/threonine-protein kinase [Vicinamibacterales bacterium]
MAQPPGDPRLESLISTIAVTGTGSAAAPLASGPAHRFAPGAIIAGRYRVVALIGRGGMGEVYRADDLTLDQPVALKFLPGAVAAGDVRLAQFHNELKTARQVSHKNVGRLYDLGDADGRRFLTMEYVDGEDLSSLLRRIGRIPHDKAVEIARQLCAGVTAAHERGVTHRDLKPSNVMIDGDGNVRIMDFGIAAAATDDSAGFVGTPQYMAPEQFAGQGASVQTDIYALGLTLFEVFTGRRAVDATTLQDLRGFHERGTVTTPSSIVRDLDPAVERVILRCLDRDPARRPVSALVVAAALPGADPLAAALAAGETPSPELLAAAAETSALPVGGGLLMVAIALGGLLAFSTISSQVSIVGRTPLPKSPAVLADRAEQIVASLGYRDRAADRDFGFTPNDPLLNWLRNQRPTPDKWNALNAGVPSGVLFWYRTSRQPLRPTIGMAVEMDDPPMTANMRTVVLDPAGRLLTFRSVPPQRDPDASSGPDWGPLFAAAELDRAAFVPATPQWTPRDYGDTRESWDGPLGHGSTDRIHVEAAAYHGRPVWFAVYGPWNRPQAVAQGGAPPSLNTLFERGAILLMIAVLFTIIGAAIVLARRNLRQNRADRRGAIRVAGAFAAMSAGGWLLAAHHLADVPSELNSAVRAGGQIALLVLIIWVLYVALEPYVRRFWPDSLLGWTRLASGRLRDPRCGRDLLIGIAVGVVIALIELAKVTVPPLLGAIAPYPTMGDRPRFLSSAFGVANGWLSMAISGIEFALLAGMMVVVLRLTIRWSWLRAIVAAWLLSLLCIDGIGSNFMLLLAPLAAGAVLAWLLLRHGLLALAVAWGVRQILMTVPFVPAAAGWSGAAGDWTLAALTLLTAFAFYAARAGQPLFGMILRD